MYDFDKGSSRFGRYPPLRDHEVRRSIFGTLASFWGSKQMDKPGQDPSFFDGTASSLHPTSRKLHFGHQRGLPWLEGLNPAPKVCPRFLWRASANLKGTDSEKRQVSPKLEVSFSTSASPQTTRPLSGFHVKEHISRDAAAPKIRWGAWVGRPPPG